MRHTPQRALLLTAAAAALGLGLWLLALLGLAWLALPPEGRSTWLALLASVRPLLLLAWVLGSAALVGVWQRWASQPGRSLAQLGEHARVLLASTPAPASSAAALAALPSATARPLAQALTALAAQRDDLHAHMAEQVRLASGHLQQEKDRLAALLAELPQCVLVCNLEGRILLYNQRARQQLGHSAQGAAVGIGRAIDTLLDRTLVEHALQRVRQRLGRGDPGAAARAQAHFITHSPQQQWLRVQLSPVLAGAGPDSPDGPDSPAAAGAAAPPAITGFVLLLEDITHSFAQEAERDHLLHSLTEGNRASLAAIRAAVEMLGYDDIPADMRQRFLAVVQEETTRMGTRIDTLSRRAAQEVHTRWPLEDMLGDELVAAAQHHLHSQLGLPIHADASQPGLWLRVDGYSLLQALAYLGQRLMDEFSVRALRLRLQAADGQRAHLDLVWSGLGMSTETVMGWELDSLEVGGERSPLTVRDVLNRHDGEMWFERDRASHTGFLRFLLPQGHAQDERPTPPGPQPDGPHASRPEFYDFDLFQHQEPDSALDERPLSALRYTVFDTETTGLHPAEGDQIIQIGAVRIVNGRLLPQECFDQLIDPQRDIPPAGIPIHGITPAMVAGQPRIDSVLPAFHQFAADSVLVAHNAAFDMKFLQLLQTRTGVVFQQPVLDTLLLSAVAHPHQDSHRLEALAERLGIPLAGRHTALGDALVTAQAWLRLIPQLQAQGIHTLRQAREAAQKTYYARIQY